VAAVVLPAAAGAADAPSNARHGAALIAQTGCGACHSIPGIENAHGLVGPPLGNIGERTVIAGLLPNTPGNMVRWLENPQRIVPGNAMPDMGLSAADAGDIAAYLETLKQE
jgi:cytochrome c2